MSNAGAQPGEAEGAEAILDRAAERARAMGLHYAGAVTPAEANRLRETGTAILVDVRTPGEYRDVGHVPGTPLVEWPRGGGADALQGFVDEIARRYQRDDALLLLCRSGVRSHYAAHLLAQAGFGRAFNVLEGFEGAAPGQGWRAAGLPSERG